MRPDRSDYLVEDAGFVTAEGNSTGYRNG